MADSDNAFFGLKVPEGTDRRELYKSQYRAIYTYKMSASELDEAFRTAVTGDGPDGGWSIKNDERVKYVGKLEVSKGDDTTLKVRGGSLRGGRRAGGARGRGPARGRRREGAGGSARASERSARSVHERARGPRGGGRPLRRAAPHPLLAHAPLLTASARRPPSQVTMEDYPEAGMSALKYYTVQSYTK